MKTGTGSEHRHRTKSNVWYDLTDLASGSLHTHDVDLSGIEARLAKLEADLPPVVVPPPPVIVVPPPPPPTGVIRFAPPVTTRTVDITVSDLTGATDMTAEIQAQIGTSGTAYRFPASGTIRLNTRLTVFSKNNISFDVRGCSLRSGTITWAASASRIFDVYNSTHIKVFSSTLNGDLRGRNANPGSLGIGPFPENDLGHMVSVLNSSYVEVTGFTSQGAWGDFVQIGLDVTVSGLTHHIWVHDNDIADVGRSFISILNGNTIWFERNVLGRCGLQVFNIEPYQADAYIHHVYFLNNGGAQDYAHVVSGSNFGVWANLGNGTPTPVTSRITDIYLDDNTCSAKVMQTILTQASTPRRARFYVRRNKSTFPSTTPLYGHPAIINLRYVDTAYVHDNLQNGSLTSLSTTSVTDLHTTP